MTSYRASTSDVPFATSTYATAPRSLVMLSPSSTPFYPQSQQQNSLSPFDALGIHDAGEYTMFQECSDVPKRHVQDWCSAWELYSQQCHTSSGPAWVSNNGNVWGGGACRSGNQLSENYVYADDEFNGFAYPPASSLLYDAESPGMEQDFYACSASDTAIGTAAKPVPGATFFNVPQCGDQAQEASCFAKVKENLPRSLKNSFAPDQPVPHCAFRKGGQAKSTSCETENALSTYKADARLCSTQILSKMYSSSGITSSTVEPRMKQAATSMAAKRYLQPDSSKLLKESCCSSVSISTEVKQKEADTGNSMPPQSSSTQLQSTSGLCSGMMLPKDVHARSHHSSLTENEPLEERNMGSVLSRPLSLITGMEGKMHSEAIDSNGKMGSSYILPKEAWLSTNRLKLLVKCIHNLSTVLLSSQSGTSSKVLDPNDRFAVENTICTLSDVLCQSYKNEGNFCQDQDCHQLQNAEQGLNIYDDKLNEETGRELIQQEQLFLVECMKHKMKAVPPTGVLENRALDGLSKLTSNACLEGNKFAEQSSTVKKEFKKLSEDMVMLQCNFAKLQEEVAYERVESNAVLMTYKALWNEAQEALNVSRLEIEELRAQLAGLRQEFANLKHSEGLGGLGADPELTKYDMKASRNISGGLHENLPDAKTSWSRDFTLQNIHSEASSKKPFPACSEVYFTPENIPNYREDLPSFARGEETTSSLNNQSGKRLQVYAMEPSVKNVGGTIIQDEVKQRLSLLLARQCLDLDKMEADRNLELPSSLSTSLEGLSNLPREGEALPPDKKGNCLIASETSYIENVNKKEGGANADLSCQMMPAFDANYGDCGLVQTQIVSRDTKGMDLQNVNVGTFEEDDVEIICFKPGADSSSVCSKEEAEWEHVVVNGLDSHNTNQKRKGDQ